MAMVAPTTPTVDMSNLIMVKEPPVPQFEVGHDVLDLQRMVEEQAEYAYKLWKIRVPQCSLDLEVFTGAEVPLLHVPRPSLFALWHAIPAVESLERLGGYQKKYWCLSSEDIFLAPNVTERTEPVWLRFNPAHGRALSADARWGDPRLAGPEVLSAMIHFPEWILSWGDSVPAPLLSGYRVRHGEGWAVPYVIRCDKTRQVRLRTLCADSSHPNWASPIVSEA